MDQNTQVVRALLREDWTTFRELLQDLERQGKGTPVAIVGFAFAVAVQRYFGERRDLAEVIQFVAEARAYLLVGDDLPARECEALICATLDIEAPGVEEIVDNLDVGRIARYEMLLLARLVATAGLSEAEIDDLLMEAEHQLATWSDEP